MTAFESLKTLIREGDDDALPDALAAAVDEAEQLVTEAERDARLDEIIRLALGTPVESGEASE